MSNRGRLILSLFLALAGKVSAQTTALQVEVYDYASLKPATLHEFVATTQEILVGTGLSIHVKLCGRSVAVPCETQTGSARRLVIRVVAGAARKMTNVRRPPLGQSFADSEGGTYASVFFAPVQDQAAEANVPWVTVLAYAAAHEIGHLLLGNQAHSPRGLMKANWDRNDYQAMNQNHFHFSAEQGRILANRYGRACTAEVSSDSPVARTRRAWDVACLGCYTIKAAPNVTAPTPLAPSRCQCVRAAD
jgi:hypothetical protein